MNLFLGLLLIAQALVNLVGALGPELGFDALWYHLTIPKLYLIWGRIRHIPGNLLYFSGFPHLTELIYMLALRIQGEELAKVIHWSFGAASAFVLYKTARRYLKRRTALLVTVMFYSNLVVGWQSITAYVDLARTFWEILALSLFLQNKILLTGIILGLAVSTKILSLGSAAIFVFLLLIFKKPSRGVFLIIIPVLVSLAPWLIFNFISIGNPFYPLFNYNLLPSHYRQGSSLVDFLILFLDFDYRISPLYPIFLIVVIFTRTYKKLIPYIYWYVLVGFLVWFLTPRTGYGRFFLPYLPALSLVCGSIFEAKFFNEKILKPVLLSVVFFFAIFNLFYRAMANVKFLPVILGKQTKSEFLLSHLNFGFGDFYDVDGWFSQNIKETDLILVYNIHNLYYLDFPFVHESWVEESMDFTHVLVKDMALPAKFSELPLIYENQKTGVKLYKL